MFEKFLLKFGGILLKFGRILLKFLDEALRKKLMKVGR
jgi:hypothetical protein